MHLEELESLLNKVSKIVALPLAVVDLVPEVCIFGLEQVHDWQDLSVVWHQSLANGVGAGYEGLQDFQGNCDNLWVSRVQSSLDWNNKLWDERQNFGATLLKHIKNTLDS